MFRVEAAVLDGDSFQVFEACAGSYDECMSFIEKNALQSEDCATCYYRIVGGFDE